MVRFANRKEEKEEEAAGKVIKSLSKMSIQFHSVYKLCEMNNYLFNVAVQCLHLETLLQVKSIRTLLID